MYKLITLLILLQSISIVGQYKITRLTEMQKLFFVAEASDLASTSYNPAAMSVNLGDHGILLGYDFNDFNKQGNSSVFFNMDNLGFSYQDIYNFNNIRLLNYAVNISIGNNILSIGTINRYTIAKYGDYDLKEFSFDAGLIFRPIPILSIGILARNLGETQFDSLAYNRNYTAGIGLTFLDETLGLYVDVDFVDGSQLKDASGIIGLLVAPLNLFEFRGGVILNPNDLINIKASEAELIKLKYEAFLSTSFLVKDQIRLTLATQFNDKGEKTRITAIFGFPLSRQQF